ncbi:hypothetical protein INT43_003460 [Umbelopsis isabellina]|uniref:MABP domain-containing protein n=1 Tax=Mortierella isabellina TaxID=91625 RepID=A0A8H7UE37_MORIS|nr:hypothetical protein INT43_003460 [Umbelopsis isabellina]
MVHKPHLWFCLLLLSITTSHAYVTHLELTSCKQGSACSPVPGFKMLPVNVNQDTDLDSVFLHLRNDHTSPPITDLMLVQAPQPTEIDGWTYMNINLHQNSNQPKKEDSNAIWLYYTRNTTISNRPITSIIIKQGKNQDGGVGYRRLAMDLNTKVGGEHLYYHQDGSAEPITAISAKSCFSDDCYIEGWERVPKDVNEGVIIGFRVYLFFKRERGNSPVTDMVVVLDDQTPPEGYIKVDVDLNSGTVRGASIFLYYKIESNLTEDDLKTAVQQMAVAYGDSLGTPYGWNKINVDLNSQGHDSSDGFGQPTFLFFRRGYEVPEKVPPLTFKADGTFKILQLADLHFSNNKGKCRDVPPNSSCEGDSTTVASIEKLLKSERPDLVVFTGDNIDGIGGVNDARTATLKYSQPVIEQRIPWAMIFGNHDDENDLSREELFEVVRNLPYSISEEGPFEISGVGNYVLKIWTNGTDAKLTEKMHAFTVYLFDSHAYANPEKTVYGEIKQDQLEWYRNVSQSFKTGQADTPNAIAFFHIPMPEYNNLDRDGHQQPILGDKRETVSSGKDTSYSILSTFREGGDIRATGCGHDHVNDYCMNAEGIALCYAGGMGVNGYGAGHLGWPRRSRVWLIEDFGSTIRTWKRLDDKMLTMIHYQTLTND